MRTVTERAQQIEQARKAFDQITANPASSRQQLGRARDHLNTVINSNRTNQIAHSLHALKTLSSS